MVHRIWGEIQEAELSYAWTQRTGIKLENISPNDKIIFLKPGILIIIIIIINNNE